MDLQASDHFTDSLAVRALICWPAGERSSGHHFYSWLVICATSPPKKDLGEALTTAGVNCLGYSGHSFRIVAATAAAWAHILDSNIQEGGVPLAS